jgi:hypothetical protein
MYLVYKIWVRIPKSLFLVSCVIETAHKHQIIRFLTILFETLEMRKYL